MHTHSTTRAVEILQNKDESGTQMLHNPRMDLQCVDIFDQI